jgi:acyl-CoA dehydrogenase
MTAAVTNWLGSGEAVTVPVPTVASTEADARFGLGVRLAASWCDGGVKVSGPIPWLCDGRAHAAVVPILLEDGGTGLAAIRLDQPGVTTSVADTVVAGHASARAQAVDVFVPEDLVIDRDVTDAMGAAGVIWSLLLDAHAVGICRTLTRRSVDFADTREQFGQPIGTFQAVQHMAADMHIATESAYGVLLAAADAVQLGLDGAFELVLASRLHCAQSAKSVCETAIQIHGGAGFTWELGLDRWYRFAMLVRHYLTDSPGIRGYLAAQIRARAAAALDAAVPDVTQGSAA